MGEDECRVLGLGLAKPVRTRLTSRGDCCFSRRKGRSTLRRHGARASWLFHVGVQIGGKWQVYFRTTLISVF